MKKRFVLAAVAGVFSTASLGCATQQIAREPASETPKHNKPTTNVRGAPLISSFFATPSPSGLGPVIDQINGATVSIHLFIYNLTDPNVGQALIQAASRGVNIQIIENAASFQNADTAALAQTLQSHGITVISSSPAFHITHAKSMTIDSETSARHAVIMSLNLTQDYATTRDFAVVTSDTQVISEFETVFSADIQNAAAGTGNTPPLSDPYLLWSPVNSQSRLVALINSAQKTVIATTENLGDPTIQAAFAQAASRGVQVRLMTPLCDKNSNPFLNVPLMLSLGQSGVLVRSMPAPSTSSVPYMHAKMITVDGRETYIGSVNFSNDSTQRARELGIQFTDAQAIAAFSADFEADWANAIPTPASTAQINCPAAN